MPESRHTTQRRVLVIHQNFPGQFRHVLTTLKDRPDVEVLGIGRAGAPGVPGVKCLNYQVHRAAAQQTHPYCRSFENAVLHGQAVCRVLLQLKAAGFEPDTVLAHPGWGETLYLREVFPHARLIHLCEWFYGANSPDLGFDPEFPVALNDRLRVSTWRAHHLLALEQCDMAIAPTHWQKNQFPAAYQAKIQVQHEGIATDVLGPNPNAQLTLPNGLVLRAADAAHTPVVTYVARNLEPYRGFHVFMRSLPALLAAHPGCQVLIVGGDDVSYGRAPTHAPSWREALLREVTIDPHRVHFLGKLPYAQYRRVLQVSSAHVYLTYPFVLSWSLLEALASGCAVVASDTAPVREVVHHAENGLLVDFFDGEGLVNAVLRVLMDAGGMKVMRQVAVASVKGRFEEAAGTARYLEWLGVSSKVCMARAEPTSHKVA